MWDFLNIRQPIRYGFFNGNCYNDAIDDLYKLTVYAITKKLKIPLSELKEMNSIIIIPDVFNRLQIKALVDMFLRQLCFKNTYLHLESILVSFGANI
jgi:actin-related protein 8